MDYFYVGKFYLKGLDHDVKTDIWNSIYNDIIPMDRQFVFDKDNGYKTLFDEGFLSSQEDVNDYLDMLKKKFESINKRMEKQNRAHLFEITEDLIKTMERRDFLIQYLPENECAKLLNCKSYTDFEPPLLESDKSKQKTQC